MREPINIPAFCARERQRKSDIEILANGIAFGHDNIEDCHLFHYRCRHNVHASFAENPCRPHAKYAYIRVCVCVHVILSIRIPE